MFQGKETACAKSRDNREHDMSASLSMYKAGPREEARLKR